MAYLKLQVSKGLSVSPSDTVDIPNPQFIMTSGTTTAALANLLIDGGADFLSTVEVGNIVINTTDGTKTTVTAVNNDTTLTIADDIMTIGEAYTIYKIGETGGAILYVGGSGNIKLTTASGSVLTFNGLNAGTFVPVQTIRVWNTGTTATNILALW